MAPLWRQAFNSWEKAAAPLLEQTAASPAFRDFLRVSVRVNKAVAAEFESASRQWLHAMNLPAATDVRKMRSQLRQLDAELQRVQRTLGDLAADTALARQDVEMKVDEVEAELAEMMAAADLADHSMQGFEAWPKGTEDDGAADAPSARRPTGAKKVKDKTYAETKHTKRATKAVKNR